MAKIATLGPNEKRFCAIYIGNGRNGTRAYMAIAPKVKETSAAVTASEWLRRINIQQEIDRLTTEGYKKSQASADAVLAELANLGFSDIGNLSWRPGELDSAGNPTTVGEMKPLHEMPAHVRRSIKSIKWDMEGRPEITMWADKPALTHLARHHKLLNETVNVNIAIGFADRLRGIRDARLKELE